jgi:ABC-type transporter MlaC component
MKKALLIIAVGLAATAAITYMLYDGRRRKTAIIVPDFIADDEALYTLMRAELITHLDGKYAAWFDDEVSAFYKTATIGNMPSKSAAFMKAFERYASNPDYIGKNNRFKSLFKNLKNRYS